MSVQSMMTRYKDNIHGYIWNTFGSNGWKWYIKEGSNKEDLSTYKLDILGEYTTTVTANICDDEDELCCNGHYGVSWLDADYEYSNRNLSYEELEDILYALESAEDNLLSIGIPFSPRYKFHGSNRANKKRRNDSLRRRLNLDYLEKKAGWGD